MIYVANQKNHLSSYLKENLIYTKYYGVPRNFRADKPNQKWLTDVTEFSIPAGKVYLSPIIDCYDGMLVAWNISCEPNAQLVNRLLDRAISTFPQNARLIIHSNRGGHYRWQGWLVRTRKAGLSDQCLRRGVHRTIQPVKAFSEE
ncbi:MAG: hypothetical protein ACFWUC_06795 [Oscillospiraceae bacterium]